MDFSYLDIGLFIFLFIFGFIGYIVGFTEKIFSIISWSASISLTFYTYEYVKPFMDKVISKPSMAGIVTGFGLFIIYILIFSLISKRLHERVQKSAFQKADRYLGAVMGFVTAFLILSLVALISKTIIPENQYAAWSKKSVLWRAAENSSDMIHHLLPTYSESTASKQKNIPISDSGTSHKEPTTSTKREVKYSKNDRQQMHTLVKEYT